MVHGGRTKLCGPTDPGCGETSLKDDASREALPLDLESVCPGPEADVWINPGAAGSLADIARVDPSAGDSRDENRAGVQQRPAHGNWGGNDYRDWELFVWI
ncbi:MAG: hypothetical protein R2751_12015 [Bacteroidales bacterium]